MHITKTLLIFVLMKKIVIACDSFKGSLSSLEAAAAIAQGIGRVALCAPIVQLPIADGGEGTVAALVEGLGGCYVQTPVHDPLGRPITARYGLIDRGEQAVIELAAASGLTLLRPEERDPLRTSTFGFGEQIAHALRAGCRKFRLGIGGSATNDGGVGMLQALGFRFFDRCGCELHRGGGGMLEQIVRIDGSQVMAELAEAEFRVACDVENPLCGPTGAAAVYGPQKGADPAAVVLLDRGLRHFSEVIRSYNGAAVADLRGGGAAGGVGAALVALLHAEAAPGIEWLLDTLHFDETIADAQLVITGEGHIDRQTLMGKAPMGVLRRAMRANVPCIAVGGCVTPSAELSASGFAALYEAKSADQSLAEAMQPKNARDNLRRVAAHIACRWSALAD